MNFRFLAWTLAALMSAVLPPAAMALTVTPGAVTLVAGATTTVRVSGVSGKLQWVNASPTVAIVSAADSSSFRISGVTAGQTQLSFKDSRSTAQTTITVQGAGPTAALSGRLLASNCFQCHGTNGSGGFERLSGKSAREIYSELKKFANGSEDPGSLMAVHAAGYSDAQLNAIATYLSTLR